jgi:hypothetical protein
VGLVCFLHSHPTYVSPKKENFFKILNAPYIFNQKITFAHKENLMEQLTLFSAASCYITPEAARGPVDIMDLIFSKDLEDFRKKNYPQFANILVQSELPY